MQRRREERSFPFISVATMNHGIKAPLVIAFYGCNNSGSTYSYMTEPTLNSRSENENSEFLNAESVHAKLLFIYHFFLFWLGVCWPFFPKQVPGPLEPYAQLGCHSPKCPTYQWHPSTFNFYMCIYHFLWSLLTTTTLTSYPSPIFQSSLRNTKGLLSFPP